MLGRSIIYVKAEDKAGNEGRSSTHTLTVKGDCIILDLFNPIYEKCGKVSINGYVGKGQGHIVRLVWDWGDKAEKVSSWFPATHQYTRNGDYVVHVTAYPDQGTPRTESVAVHIINANCEGAP